MGRRAVADSPTYPQDRLQFIEGLRGVAALYVVLSHFRSMVDPSELAGKASRAPAWLQHVLAPFSQGNLAVAAFIVLSGFCLQVSLFNGKDGRISDLRRFFARRAWRILPPYYACLIFSTLVAVTVTAHQPGLPFSMYVPVTGSNFFAHLFLIHDLSPDWMYKINAVLWSIALEAQLYLLFPSLVKGLFRYGRVAVLGASAALAALVLVVFPSAMKLYPWFLPLFVLGMATAYFAYRPHPKVGILPWAGSLACGIGIALAIWAGRTKQILPIADASIGIAVAGLIYLGSIAPHRWLPRLFARPALVKVGAFSYSLYLMHHPIEQILYVYRPGFIQGPVAGFAYLLVIGLPIILAATYGFSLVFERPFIRSRKTVEPVLRDGLGAPLSLPLRTIARPRPDYIHSKRFARAIVSHSWDASERRTSFL